MAVIQPIEARRGIDTGSVPNIRISDAAGQGLRAAGGAISQAAEVEHSMQMRQQRMALEMQEFRTDQAFRRFGDEFSLDFVKTQQDIDPSGENFATTVAGEFDKKAGAFLQSVPEALKPKFAELIATSKEAWLNKAAAAEIDQRNSWYRTGIVEAQEKLQTQVFNDPSLYDAAKEDGLRAIGASGLPRAEKEALRKAWEDTLSLTVGEREIRDAEQSGDAGGAARRLGVPGASAETEGGGDVMSLLRNFEGFRHTPYWDVNTHRVGYGSDTITRADGSVHRVTRGMRITRADGERDLARRAKEFEATARDQVGAREWGALSGGAQAALVSVAYNYGSLPANVVNAVKTGDLDRIAAAVEGRAGDNDGINHDRRMQEAAIIRGAAIAGNKPDFADDDMDPRYVGLSLEKRLELFDRMQAAEKAGQTRIRGEATAAYDAHKGSLELGIETGKVASERTILDDPVLKDAHKADLVKAFRTKNEDTLAAQEAVRLFSAGQLRVDPYDTKARKTVDNAWKAISSAVPQEQLQPAVEDMVRQTGVVPQQVVNLIRQGLTSQNAQAVAQAAQAAQRISAIDPAALSRRDGGSEAQTAADDFAHYVNRLNLSPEDAARRMVEAGSPEKKVARKALEPAAKEFVKGLGAEDLASLFNDSWFASDPDLGFSPGQALGIQADFLAIAEDQFFAANGDAEIAKNRAVEEMKRLYGVTQVTGRKVVMKHPPESYWPLLRTTRKTTTTTMVEGREVTVPAKGDEIVVGDTPSLDYARFQLRDDLREIEPDIDMDTVQFVTTPETDAMVKRGEMPGYAVLYKDENGVLQTIPGKLWRPNTADLMRIQREHEAGEQAERVEEARRIQGIERQEIQRRDIIDQRQRQTGQILRGEVPTPIVPPDLTPTPRDRISGQRQQLRDDAVDSGLLPGTVR